MNERHDLVDTIEFYKIACQNFENDIDRRLRMNQFYFTVSASISAAASFVLINKKMMSELGFTETLFITFIGSLLLMILSINVSWLVYIKAHSRLQIAQLEVIKSMEAKLSNVAIGAVNELFYKNVGRFDRTFAERLIPISFLIFGVALLAQVIIAKL